jgi:hypothetical protein
MKSAPIDNCNIAPETIATLEGSQRLTVTLPKRTVVDLQAYDTESALSKKIRFAVELYLQVRKELAEGGELYVRRPDNLLYRVEIPT